MPILLNQAKTPDLAARRRFCQNCPGCAAVMAGITTPRAQEPEQVSEDRNATMDDKAVTTGEAN